MRRVDVGGVLILWSWWEIWPCRNGSHNMGFFLILTLSTCKGVCSSVILCSSCCALFTFANRTRLCYIYNIKLGLRLGPMGPMFLSSAFSSSF